jgi:regulator of nucleoside diphosphate kinase
MSRPEIIYLRTSDAETLERLIQGVSDGRDAPGAALLDEELARATIVPDDALPPQTVALDSRVRFQDENTGQVREVTLVVPSKVSPEEGRISVLSPIGSALIGLSVHDDIDWPVPGGKLRRLRVLDVA